jgi:hypothetical protein
MNIISVDYSEVISEFEIVKEWINTIQYNILGREINEENIVTFYHYGYFLPKVQNKEDFYQHKFEQYSTMKFEDRLREELSKVRVNVTIKIGEFMMTNRLGKGKIPKIIEDIVTEVTKYKMAIEGSIHNNLEVVDSIPDFDTSIVSIELVKEQISREPRSYELDDILDKISELGIESLTDEEREFLKNQSKNI